MSLSGLLVLCQHITTRFSADTSVAWIGDSGYIVMMRSLHSVYMHYGLFKVLQEWGVLGCTNYNHFNITCFYSKYVMLTVRTQSSTHWYDGKIPIDFNRFWIRP